MFTALLWPLAKLTEIITRRRYQSFQKKNKLPQSFLRPSIPIIIVGNLTVGGTGKTPLVIALVKKLLAAGYFPGVISRGYGAQANHYPMQVTPESHAQQVGDEPFLIYQQTQVPVVIDPDRVKAWQFLLEKNSLVDIIISDDGLQHYALARDVEIVMVDAVRGFGNQLCLPAGPLREPLSRLNSIDFLIVNGRSKKALAENQITMQLKFEGFFSVKNNQLIAADYFHNKACYALAGIGNPQRFFNSLRNQLIHFETAVFPDHYAYTEKDFSGFMLGAPIIMTEKDAVKCQSFAEDHWFYLKVSAELPESCWCAILERVKKQ